MFEHLLNCHGEWNAAFAFIGSLPFLGVWFRSKINHDSHPDKTKAENESR